MNLLLDTHAFLWYYAGSSNLSTNARLTIENPVSAVLPPHHRDPFDRLIIGQALTEQMVVITKDSLFETYCLTSGLQVIW